MIDLHPESLTFPAIVEELTKEHPHHGSGKWLKYLTDAAYIRAPAQLR